MEKIWDTPSFDEDTTPEEALELIEQFTKDTHKLADHPYNVREHRQHADVLAYRDKLYSRAYPAESGEEDEEEDEDEQQAEEHSALVEQAQEEMDRLGELGFRRDEISDDIQPFQVTALKMQRLNAERNFTELTPMLEQELTSLGAQGMDTFRSFARDAGLTADERAEHIDLILKRIYQANKERKNGF